MIRKSSRFVFRDSFHDSLSIIMLLDFCVIIISMIILIVIASASVSCTTIVRFIAIVTTI